MNIVMMCEELLENMIEKTGKPWYNVFESVEFDHALCEMLHVEWLEEVEDPDFWKWYMDTADDI